MSTFDLSECPYFRGEGQCQSGCFSEPSCITDRPLEGWPGEKIRPRHERTLEERREEMIDDAYQAARE